MSARDDYPLTARNPTPEQKRLFNELDARRSAAASPVLDPTEGVPLRLFGNAVVCSPDREGYFGIVDKHGITHWIEMNFR